MTTLRQPKGFAKYFRPFDVEPLQAALTDELQLADILESCIRQSRHSDDLCIWMTSFSISEEFIRRLYFIRKKTPIKHFRLLLDFKAMQKTLRLWHFLNNVIEECYLGNNHSKLILLQNETEEMTIITSQNLTRGNRYESYCLATDHKVFVTYLDKLEYILKHKTIRLNDVIRGKLADN